MSLNSSKNSQNDHWFGSVAGSIGSLANSVVETQMTCQWVLDLYGAAAGSPSGYFFFCVTKQQNKCYFALMVGNEKFWQLGTLQGEEARRRFSIVGASSLARSP